MKYSRSEVETLIIEKTSLTPITLKYLTSTLSSCINIERLSLEDIVNSENLANLESYLPPLMTSL